MKIIKNYIITDGNRFIYRNYKNKYVPANGESMAEHFTKSQAENVLRNLRKDLRKNFYIEKIRELPEIEVKPQTRQDIKNNTEKVVNSAEINQWISKLDGLNGLLEEAKKREDELLNKLRLLDNELLDLVHYCEFSKLNACQGYAAYKMVHNKRVERRSVKNELAVLQIILSKDCRNFTIEEIKQQINKLDTRKYQPRVLVELFDY